MESWVLYAIVSLFIVGLYNFGMKMIAKRNYNTSFVTIISYSTASMIAGIYYFFTHQGNFLVEGFLIIGLFALLHRIFLFASTLARVEGLKNIDTTIFYPVYKAFFPILMTAISVFYFGESLSWYEGLGIFIGISIPLLLINKVENTLQSNLKLGIVFIIITTITAGLGSFLTKILTIKSLDLDLFIFLGYSFGVVISSLNYKFLQKKTIKQYSQEGVYKFGIILGIITLLGHYTYVYSLTGNLAIAVTINSFSILIPIILSVIFYKEEMTIKKAFVIFLSI
ncbi:EamA family transporter, partial [Candidatus Gracilibacteria bacterium]|nr:EamA family transporter [Candidatus Gracilibacteria bacterium]